MEVNLQVIYTSIESFQLKNINKIKVCDMENFFIGRTQELAALNQLLDKKTASLVTLQGRRRIGKSRLIKEFARKHLFLNFSGLPPTKKTTTESEKAEFSAQLANAFDLPGVYADNWSTLFSLLAKQAQRLIKPSEKLIILFDEISWMSTKDDSFLGKLKTAWDNEFKEISNLVLVLCGSVSAWIEENILSSTGFMGRLSLTLTLEPLPIKTCNQLLIKMGFKASNYEKFKMLSVTGGIPRYIEELQPALSADDNIHRLCFKKSGILFREFQDIFNDLFTVKSLYHQKIVEALVDGPLEYQAICEKLGVQRSGFWLSYLNELILSGFVSKEAHWSIKTGLDSRLSHYRLSDNYLRFYLKYVAPHRSKIEKKLFNHQSLSSFPGWDGVMGLQFENLVLNNLPWLLHALQLSSNDVVNHGPYFQNKTKAHAGCQIDCLIKTRHNTLIICEIKFSRNKIGSEVIPSIQHKIESLVIPRGLAVWPILIHINGVTPDLAAHAFFTKIIDFSEALSETISDKFSD